MSEHAITVILVDGGMAAGVAAHAMIGARFVLRREFGESLHAFRARAIATAELGEFVVIGGLPL